MSVQEYYQRYKRSKRKLRELQVAINGIEDAIVDETKREGLTLEYLVSKLKAGKATEHELLLLLENLETKKVK